MSRAIAQSLVTPTNGQHPPGWHPGVLGIRSRGHTFVPPPARPPREAAGTQALSYGHRSQLTLLCPPPLSPGPGGFGMCPGPGVGSKGEGAGASTCPGEGAGGVCPHPWVQGARAGAGWGSPALLAATPKAGLGGGGGRRSITHTHRGGGGAKVLRPLGPHPTHARGTPTITLRCDAGKSEEAKGHAGGSRAPQKAWLPIHGRDTLPRAGLAGSHRTKPPPQRAATQHTATAVPCLDHGGPCPPVPGGATHPL